MTTKNELDDTSGIKIPTKPLLRGHAEVYDRYVELRSEEWVEKVERETSVYEFALAFVDSKRKHGKFEKDGSNHIS